MADARLAWLLAALGAALAYVGTFALVRAREGRICGDGGACAAGPGLAFLLAAALLAAAGVAAFGAFVLLRRGMPAPA